MSAAPEMAPGDFHGKAIDIHYLSGLDIERLAMTDDEILAAVENALRAQGTGDTVIEPRVHLVPENSATGHFNILRGYIRPLDVAGIKIVGDYTNNYVHGYPTGVGIVILLDPKLGIPRAFMDGTAITEMRTGAMTAIGAKFLARKNSKILGHVGARGSSYWNVRLLDHLFDFAEIRVHSRRKESCDAFAARLSKELGKTVTAVGDWETCVRDADIVVEASRLPRPMPLLKTEWIAKGALVIPYGTMSAIEISLADIMNKIVVDDWGQCKPGHPFGALREIVDSGKLNERNLHAELGQIVAGRRKGREAEGETILFWHRGLSTSDIALGLAMVEKARQLGVGTPLRFR